MAQPFPLQTQFVRMIRDLPREELPKGSVWNLVDYIPQLDAALTKRGGWSWGSDNISTEAAGAVYVNSVVYAPFSSGAQLCAMTDNSKFVTVNTSTNAVTLVSAAGVQSVQRPHFHDNKLIITASDGVTAPKVYDGTSLANLGGSPPSGKFSSVWKDFTVLGPTAAEPRRTYWSGLASPESWNTTESFTGTLAPVTGYAALPNAFLIFMETSTARIKGSLPPPGTDFIGDDPIFNYGCSDARSIAVQGGYAIFCNPLGVFRTNGTNLPEDLTEQAGVQRYWRSLFSGYDRTSWIISGGMMNNRYFVSIVNGTSLVDSFCFDPRSNSVYRLSNMAVSMFAPAVQVGEELYAADRTSPFLRKLSPLFTPLLNSSDANAVAVAPILETPFYLDKRTGKKRWRNVYPQLDMRDNASTNPTMAVSYIKNPGDAYSALADPLVETSNYQYGPRVELGFRAHGLGLKFQQVGASERTQFHGILADVQVLEGSHL